LQFWVHGSASQLFYLPLPRLVPLKGWLQHTMYYPALVALLLAAPFGIVCYLAGRGVKR
jgi:hypothetical protein